MGELQRGFIEAIDPPLASPFSEQPTISYWHCHRDDGTQVQLASCRILKSNGVHSYNNGTYIRSASQNRQIGAQAIHSLCLKRGVDSYVNQTIDVPEELLVTEWWHQYATQRQLTRTPSDALKHLGLTVKQSSGKWMPTVAAVLLFAEEPSGLLCRKCSIRVFHYKGHEIEYDSDTNLAKPAITISGPVLQQIREATKTINEELNSGVQRTEDGFALRQAYPSKVVQEAITNAVLHRDYSLSGDIHIRIFTNRIEVESPGLFPGAVTPNNIGKIGSKPRNPTLTNHVREFPSPPNLDAGEGVIMMQRTLEASGLYPPVFDEIQEGEKQAVVVKLSNEAKLPEWTLVEDYLQNHGTINNLQLREMLNFSRKDAVRASRMLKAWVESGLLEIENPQEGKRNRRYQITKKVVAFKEWVLGLEMTNRADPFKFLLRDPIPSGREDMDEKRKHSSP